MRLKTLVLLAAGICWAQPELDAVKKQALDHSSAYAMLEELCDRIGPRLTGSAQEAKAGEWALRKMREIGLENVHPEPWPLERGWQRGHARARLVSPIPLELIVTSYGWSGSATAREASVVMVDSGSLADESRAHSTSWAGKVLLVAAKDPKKADPLKAFAEFPAFLAAASAAHALAVIRRDERPGVALTHVAPVVFPVQATAMAMLDIAREHELLLKRLLDAGTPVRMSLDVTNGFSTGPIRSNNIVGEIRGSLHPEQVVLLGAHLDSWDLGTGAIDDGFGVAAVLGAVKSIAASGVKPLRTIRFVLFTGEEQGLLGSRAYVRAHASEDVLLALVLDWGSGLITKFPLAGHGELAAPFTELFRTIDDVMPIQTANGFLSFTDASSFTLAGVPAVAPLQNSTDYTLIGHSAGDTLDKVDANVLTRDSAVLALTAVWVANRTERVGTRWSPERTDRELDEQKKFFRVFGLWHP